MRLYLATIHWYDSYREEDQDDKVFVFGANLSQAAGHLDACFSYIQSVTIEEVQCDTGAPIIYVPNDDDLINKIVEQNTY